jgi:hypothetical protein
MKLPLIASAFAACLVVACDDVPPSEAESAVRFLGWSQVTVQKDDSFFRTGCGDDDGAKFVARGLDAVGRPARAIVCCGGFSSSGFSSKGCTVRTPR